MTTYLGDSVYAEWTGRQMILTAEDNVIVLEPVELVGLCELYKRVSSADESNEP